MYEFNNHALAVTSVILEIPKYKFYCRIGSYGKENNASLHQHAQEEKVLNTDVSFFMYFGHIYFLIGIAGIKMSSQQ